jgi:hypothetical protein
VSTRRRGVFILQPHRTGTLDGTASDPGSSQALADQSSKRQGTKRPPTRSSFHPFAFSVSSGRAGRPLRLLPPIRPMHISAAPDDFPANPRCAASTRLRLRCARKARPAPVRLGVCRGFAQIPANSARLPSHIFDPRSAPRSTRQQPGGGASAAPQRAGSLIRLIVMLMPSCLRFVLRDRGIRRRDDTDCATRAAAGRQSA